MTTARIKDIMKFEKRTEMLDEILSRKRSPLDKTRPSYDNKFNQRKYTIINKER